MIRRQSIRSFVAALLLLVAGATAGCFGRFPAMTAVYNFNKGVSSNRVVQSLVMIGLVVIPVYGITFLVDALVLNVIDFFKGSGAVAATPQTLADGSTVELIRLDSDTVRVRHVDLGGQERTFDIVRVGDGAGFVRAEDGRILGTVEALADGTLVEQKLAAR